MGCFTLCWLPYFVVILTQIFDLFEQNSPTLYKAVFSLAMANSMMNPVIYAWKNTNFRHAFTKLLTCRKPDQLDCPQTGDSPRNKTSKRDGSRSHHDAESGTNRAQNTATSRNSQPSAAESIAQINDNEITVISSLHDEAVQNHTIQLSIGTPSSRDCSTTGPASITTHIIKGNVIINNYNLYESFLDVKNENRRNGSFSTKSSTNETDDSKKQARESNTYKDNHNCDIDDVMGSNNPCFQEDVTRL